MFGAGGAEISPPPSRIHARHKVTLCAFRGLGIINDLLKVGCWRWGQAKQSQQPCVVQKGFRFGGALQAKN